MMRCETEALKLLYEAPRLHVTVTGIFDLGYN